MANMGDWFLNEDARKRLLICGDAGMISKIIFFIIFPMQVQKFGLVLLYNCNRGGQNVLDKTYQRKSQ